MLYWRISPNRTIFLNEYWVFLPTSILINYLIIRKIRLNRARMKQLENLICEIERQKKIRKLLWVSIGLTASGYTHLLTRGGSTDFLDLIDTDYIKSMCRIEENLNWLNDARLRQIVSHLYQNKSKGKVIYITATALCHLANRYGQMFFALPFAIGDFGLTSIYQTLRKGFVAILLGAVGPAFMIGSPVALFFALTLAVSGLRIAFNNLDFIDIASSPVDDVTKGLKPRIPGISDVVIVNNRNNIILRDLRDPVQENQECWLPYQRLLNPNCRVKPTEISDPIDSVLPDLRYEDVVNMQDVTGLNRVEFTDKFDLGKTKPNICKPRQGKEVNFLDKFGDSGPISESEKWDTYDNECMVPEKRYLRTRNNP